MFDVANDRLSYGDLLRPDVGYSLDFAAGLTYSLDLEALLGVPVSLGLLEDADDELMRSPLYILEAIRKSADRIAIVCNAGSIKLPHKIQSVYSLLEESVFEVKLENRGNFHPKLWVLKYSDSNGDSYIKLLVLSRNLTFDTSLDLCISMRGKVGRAKRKKNKPISDMLLFASRYSGKKAEQLQMLAEDVLYVAQFETDHPFADYEFFPMGIEGYPGENVGLFGNKYNLFAVSPFLSDDVVQRLTQCTGRKMLVTRKSSVTKKVMEAFEHTYITKDVMTDNEFGAKQDIHAKLYFTTTFEKNYLYIGSANASHNAFRRNVECLLRLEYKPYAMGFKMFCQDFLPTENCPFEELTVLPEVQPKDEQLKLVEEALREAVYALKKAAVIKQENCYAITVDARELKTGESVYIAPLQRRELSLPLQSKTVFTGIHLKELSEFYVISVRDQSVVVKVKTTGIPKERDQAIYRSIIDSKAKFMSYLAFVLAEDPAASAAESEMLSEMLLPGGDAELSQSGTTAIFEKMLRVFHQNPDRLKGVADMIRRLDHDVVGDEFVRMYEQFEKAVRRVRK